MTIICVTDANVNVAVDTVEQQPMQPQQQQQQPEWGPFVYVMDSPKSERFAVFGVSMSGRTYNPLLPTAYATSLARATGTGKTSD